MKSFRGLTNYDGVNKKVQFSCINHFLSNQLQCTFPWFFGNSGKVLKNCSTSAQLDKYYHLYTEILQQKKNDELEDFGCIPKNCVQNTWIPETLVTVDNKTLTNNPFFERYFTKDKTTFWFSTLSDEVCQF